MISGFYFNFREFNTVDFLRLLEMDMFLLKWQLKWIFLPSQDRTSLTAHFRCGTRNIVAFHLEPGSSNPFRRNSLHFWNQMALSYLEGTALLGHRRSWYPGILQVWFPRFKRSKVTQRLMLNPIILYFTFGNQLTTRNLILWPTLQLLSQEK